MAAAKSNARQHCVREIARADSSGRKHGASPSGDKLWLDTKRISGPGVQTNGMMVANNSTSVPKLIILLLP